MLEAMTIASMKAPGSATGDRILVVDDEPNICRLLQRYLGRIGYDVVTAGSVPEALDTLDGSHFDLVLTDLRLPGPSGLELLVEVTGRVPARKDRQATSVGDPRGSAPLCRRDPLSMLTRREAAAREADARCGESSFVVYLPYHANPPPVLP